MLKSTVKGSIKDGKYVIEADEYLKTFKTEMWKEIHRHSGKITKSDVSLVLGILQYELIHHDELDI